MSQNSDIRNGLASVIICTQNRSRFLERALRALKGQTVPAASLEILVVDNGSTDDTPAVCAVLAREIQNLRTVATDVSLSHADAANVGIRESRGQWILFTDDDCIPAPDWAARMLAVLEKYPVAAGAIDSDLSPYMKYCHNTAQFTSFLAGKRERRLDFFAGANVGFRREELEALGGFEPGRRLALDTELALRARRRGCVILFAAAATVKHDPPDRRERLREILRYAIKHASETIILRHRYNDVLRTPWMLRSPWIILLLSPALALAATWKVVAGNRYAFRYVPALPVVYLLKLAWCWGAALGLWSRKLP